RGQTRLPTDSGIVGRKALVAARRNRQVERSSSYVWHSPCLKQRRALLHFSRNRRASDFDRPNPSDQRRFWREYLVGLRNLSAVWTVAVPIELSRPRADVANVPVVRDAVHPCLFCTSARAACRLALRSIFQTEAGPARSGESLRNRESCQEHRRPNS